MTTIRAQRLTKFSLAANGGSIAIGVTDEEGRAGALMLPTECLRELMMTLPEMMRQALRLQHHDPGLRLVYPAAGWELERSTLPGTFIVTLQTPDGFHISFALSAVDLSQMAEAGQETARNVPPHPSCRVTKRHSLAAASNQLDL